MNKQIGYMDIHAHIIPGVDDGAESIEEAMRMIELAYAEGIRIIVATPHYGKWNPGYDKSKAVAACRKIRELIKKVHSDMRISIGNELYYTPGIIEDLKQAKALTLGGTDYVLVEFGVNADYEEIYSGLRTLAMEGYRPVLAHIERYNCLQKDLERVRELINLGGYMQVNARSFLGKRFDKRTAWCTKLLKNRMIHFIASDCHNCDSRSPMMKTAVSRMLELTDEENVYNIVHNNIVKLVQNKYI